MKKNMNADWRDMQPSLNVSNVVITLDRVIQDTQGIAMGLKHTFAFTKSGVYRWQDYSKTDKGTVNDPLEFFPVSGMHAGIKESRVTAGNYNADAFFIWRSGKSEANTFTAGGENYIYLIFQAYIATYSDSPDEFSGLSNMPVLGARVFENKIDGKIKHSGDYPLFNFDAKKIAFDYDSADPTDFFDFEGGPDFPGNSALSRALEAAACTYAGDAESGRAFNPELPVYIVKYPLRPRTFPPGAADKTIRLYFYPLTPLDYGRVPDAGGYDTAAEYGSPADNTNLGFFARQSIKYEYLDIFY